MLNVELQKGNLPTAVKLFHGLVRAHKESGALSSYWYARFNLSEALLDLGRLNDALREANAVASEQENPSLRQEALRRRAVILADQGLNDAAITQLEQLEKEQSKGNSESIRLRLCYVHAFANHPKEALRRCQELLDEKTLSERVRPDVYQVLAQAHLNLKQPKLAAEAAKKSLEIYQKMKSEDQIFCGFSQLAAAKLEAGDPSAGDFQNKAKAQFQSFTGSWSSADRLSYLNRYSIQIMVKRAQLKLH